jgi:histidinol dehydrogenase
MIINNRNVVDRQQYQTANDIAHQIHQTMETAVRDYTPHYDVALRRVEGIKHERSMVDAALQDFHDRLLRASRYDDTDIALCQAMTAFCRKFLVVWDEQQKKQDQGLED